MSAEDIGQFPDSDIGEAVARLPGVTVNRGSLNYASAAGAPTATGLVQGVNVDGFGGSFNEVLVEGRQIASGNGQTFNFADFSSDLRRRDRRPEDAGHEPVLGQHRLDDQRQVPESVRQPGRARSRAPIRRTMNSNAGQDSPNFGLLWSDTFG